MGKLSGLAGPLIKFGICLIALPFLGSFAAKCAAGISQSDAGNKKAHKYATIAAILSWVVFALIIAGIVFLFMSGAGEAEEASAFESQATQSKGNILITILDFICLAIIGVDAVLMLLVAINLDTKAKGQTNYVSWEYATGVSAGLFSLLGIYLIAEFIIWYTKRQRIKKAKQAKFNRDVLLASRQIRMVQAQLGPQIQQQTADAVQAGRLHTQLGAEIEANYQQHPENPFYSYVRGLYLQGKIKNQHDLDTLTNVIHSHVGPPPIQPIVSIPSVQVDVSSPQANQVFVPESSPQANQVFIPDSSTGGDIVYPTISS
jgi:flagellar basal body-associated protein FliL